MDESRLPVILELQNSKEVEPLLDPPSPYVTFETIRPLRPEERARFYVRLRQYIEEANRAGDQENMNGICRW